MIRSGMMMVSAAAVLLLLSAAVMSPRSASGVGSMEFILDHEEGVGMLDFKVEQKVTGVAGTLAFGAEHRHDGMGPMKRPDYYMSLDEIDDAQFAFRTVEFSGRGQFNYEPVSITARAVDGGVGGIDRFSIIVTDDNGDVVFEADGELFIGNIRVGEDG